MPFPPAFQFPSGEPGIGWVWLVHIGYEVLLFWIGVWIPILTIILWKWYLEWRRK